MFPNSVELVILRVAPVVFAQATSHPILTSPTSDFVPLVVGNSLFICDLWSRPWVVALLFSWSWTFFMIVPEKRIVQQQYVAFSCHLPCHSQTCLVQNFKRVIEVWMDEYKEYFYKKRPYVRKIDPGDLDKQKQLRKDLKCKSFKWFMTEVAPDIVKHYPPVLPEPAAWGKVSIDVGIYRGW